MHKRMILVFGLAPMVAGAGVVLAKDPFCAEMQEEVSGQLLVAKEPLYDTVVGPDGIYDLERDRDEIPRGAELTIVDLDCGKKAIELTLKPSPKGEKVEIKFLISESERESDQGHEIFERMMSYVFEEKESG